MLMTANARLMDGSRLSAAGWVNGDYGVPAEQKGQIIIISLIVNTSPSKHIPEASGDLEIV